MNKLIARFAFLTDFSHDSRKLRVALLLISRMNAHSRRKRNCLSFSLTHSLTSLSLSLSLSLFLSFLLGKSIATPRLANKLPITLRLLPRYLFPDSWKLILQGDSPRRGSSLGDYPPLQESASMRNFFFVYVFPRASLSQVFRPLFTCGNVFFGWLSSRDYISPC